MQQPPPARSGRRRLLAFGLFGAAGVLVAGALSFAVTGFAGPAPVVLVLAGFCIAGGVALLQPPAGPPGPPGSTPSGSRR